MGRLDCLPCKVLKLPGGHLAAHTRYSLPCASTLPSIANFIKVFKKKNSNVFFTKTKFKRVLGEGKEVRLPIVSHFSLMYGSKTIAQC